MVTKHVRLSCSWMAVIVIVCEWSCHQQITAGRSRHSKQQENPKTQDSKTQIFKSKCCSITSPPVNQREKTNAMIGFNLFFSHSYHQKHFPVFGAVLAPGASGLILFPLTKVNTCKIQQSGATLATIRYIYELINSPMTSTSGLKLIPFQLVTFPQITEEHEVLDVAH